MAKESTRVTKNTTKEDSERKPRGKKVVAGPKRGLSAYMYFSKEQRSVVKEENPGATFGKLDKQVFFFFKKKERGGEYLKSIASIS